jgi:beta-lactamase class A
MEIKKWLKNKRLWQWVLPIAIFAFGIFFGILADRHWRPAQDLIFGGQLRDQGSSPLIKPLLLCGVNSLEADDYKPLQKKIKEAVDNKLQQAQAKKISVYFRDLDTGRWAGVNENELYAPASMYKVPIMIAYYKLAEIHPEILQQKILYDGAFDYNQQETLKPKETIQAGKEYAIDDLIKFMIVYSDNNAATLLDQHLDHDLLSNLYAKLEIPLPPQTGDVDFLSAKIYSRFLRILYNATYLNEEISQKVLELLSQGDFPQGIRSGAPSNVVVAEKFGERLVRSDNGSIQERELHDCGIVYYPSHPYAVCVMTSGNDLNNLEGVISDISRLLYQEVDRQYH